MFDKEYAFRGDYAEKVVKLTAQISDKSQSKIFARNIDVYMVAPIVGFLYGRKAAPTLGSDKTTKIFPEQLIKEQSSLRYIYQLIVLLDKGHEPSLDERINRAFRYYGSSKAQDDEALFESYVLGGVDVLYEKIIESASELDGYLRNTFEFVEEVQSRYNAQIDANITAEILSLARS
jgi:hypothetical protein